MADTAEDRVARRDDEREAVRGLGDPIRETRDRIVQGDL